MTVTTTSSKAGPFVGNGVQTVWNTAFRVDYATDLQVIYTDVNGVDNVLGSNQYSVTGLGLDTGIAVTYPLSPGSPIGASEKITLLRVVPYDQQTNLSNQTGFYPSVLMKALDRVVMQTQQLAEKMSRAILLAASSAFSALSLPDPQAGRFLRGNAGATGWENADIVTSGAISIPVTIAQGGTQASTAAGAAANLGSAMTTQLTTTNKAAMQTGLEVVGAQSVDFNASGMFLPVTNPAHFTTIETTTNKINRRGLGFDTTTQQFAFFEWAMPSSWNEGTLKFRIRWRGAAGGAGGVTWQLQAVAISNNDNQDAALGTAVLVNQTYLGAGIEHVTTLSAALTVAGAPQPNDTVIFRVARVPADAGDTLAQDAILQHVELLMTTDQGIDA